MEFGKQMIICQPTNKDSVGSFAMRAISMIS